MNEAPPETLIYERSAGWLLLACVVAYNVGLLILTFAYDNPHVGSATPAPWSDIGNLLIGAGNLVGICMFVPGMVVAVVAGLTGKISLKITSGAVTILAVAYALNGTMTVINAFLPRQNMGELNDLWQFLALVVVVPELVFIVALTPLARELYRRRRASVNGREHS